MTDAELKTAQDAIETVEKKAAAAATKKVKKDTAPKATPKTKKEKGKPSVIKPETLAKRTLTQKLNDAGLVDKWLVGIVARLALTMNDKQKAAVREVLK